MVVTGEIGRRRPGVVTAAGAMLATGGALFALESYLAQQKYFTDGETYVKAAADGVIKNDTAWAGVGGAIHLFMQVIGVFAGLALVVLAVPALRGWGWARAVSWIFGLAILFWYGFLASVGALGFVLSGDAPPRTDPPELTRRFDEAWPPWLTTLDTVLMVAVAVLLIGALVGQTVPAADAYFRRRTGRGQDTDAA
jgi:hypothetical protein